MNRWMLVIFLQWMVIELHCQTSSDIQSYISQYKDIALEEEAVYGIPASITLAQGILESGAGKSLLTQNANNHFGIKAYGGWTGSVYLAWDDEIQKSRFRKYSSALESFRDHALFIKGNSRYHSLFSHSVYDYRAWAKGLQQAGYASAHNYAQALIGFIEAYKLYVINGGVKLRAGKTVTITNVVAAKPVIDESCIMDDMEESEEEKNVTNIVRRFVVEINNVRCTILYPGETIASISQRYDIPRHRILEYNEIADSRNFQEGDVVYLEKKKSRYAGIQDYYVVKKGETLYEVSQQFGLKMSNLAKMNNKDFFYNLREGEKLRLK